MKKTCIHGVSLKKHCPKCEAGISKDEREAIKRVQDDFNVMLLRQFNTGRHSSRQEANDPGRNIN